MAQEEKDFKTLVSFANKMLKNEAKIDEDIQAKISEQIKESFALRRKSKQLLEDAKRAVEIAIEQDEESAIIWLKDRVDL